MENMVFAVKLLSCKYTDIVSGLSMDVTIWE